MEEKCSNCKFAVEVEYIPKDGEAMRWMKGYDHGFPRGLACRRLSPRKDYTWPLVLDTHWCGEHERRLEASEEANDE